MLWNDNWKEELKKNNYKCYDRLCDCKNTKNDIKIISKLMYKYNKNNHNSIECLDRTIDWITGSNNQINLIPDKKTYRNILNNLEGVKELNFTEFKIELHKLVLNDYGFELYNYNENIIRFSFYNLNSCYNAFCTILINENEYPRIQQQYTRENKKINKIVKNIVLYIQKYYKKHHNYNKIIKEIEYYNTLSNNIFENKYGTDIEYHTFY